MAPRITLPGGSSRFFSGCLGGWLVATASDLDAGSQMKAIVHF